MNFIALFVSVILLSTEWSCTIHSIIYQIARAELESKYTAVLDELF